MTLPDLPGSAFRELDLAFAQFLAQFDPAPEIALAGAWVSRLLGEGNSCLDLRAAAGHVDAGPALPPVESWLARLEKSPAVARGDGEAAPLVLDGERLYLHRYWHYECEVAARLRERLATPALVDTGRLADGLSRLFPPEPDGIDAQAVAAALAVLRPFAIVSGGPGTGKTYTVTRLLALLLEQGRPLKIALAAPTGKARARLTESLLKAVGELDCAASIRATITEAARRARTLHGLIGIVPGRAGARFHRDRPMPYDLVVVDEASMIDLPLMHRLLDALPAEARLILVGDRHQLPPVDVGNLLGDLCEAAGETGFSAALVQQIAAVLAIDTSRLPVRVNAGSIRDSLAELTRPRRFARGSGIAALAQAVDDGDEARCLTALQSHADLAWHASDSDRLDANLLELIRRDVLPCLRADDLSTALTRQAGVRILSALRQGPLGVESLNQRIETLLARETAGRFGRGRWYRGKPVMITRNHPALGLNNGDVGLCWPDPASGELRVFFPRDDGEPRSLAPSRLPEHETAFVLTVHKSQGSEFDHVHLLLPDQPSPLLTRELIYTAVTRAKSSFVLYGAKARLLEGIQRRLARSSGLAQRLEKV